MSSKKKQVQDESAEKKKFPLFNLSKLKGSEKAKKKDNSVAATDNAVTAAVLHSNEADKPSTSKNGQLSKITRFFKKGQSIQGKNAPKNIANNIAEKEQKVTESRSESDDLKETQPTAEVTDATSQKADVSEPFDNALRRDKAATKLQAVFRGLKQRRKYLYERQQVVKVEAIARGFLARKQVADMKGSEENLNEGTDKQAEQTVDKIKSEDLITFL